MILLLLLYISYRNCKYPHNNNNNHIEKFTTQNNKNNIKNKRILKTIEKSLTSLEKINIFKKYLDELKNNPDSKPCYLNRNLFQKCKEKDNVLSDTELLKIYKRSHIKDEKLKKKILERIHEQENIYKKKLDEICALEASNCIKTPDELKYMDETEILKYISELEDLLKKGKTNKVYYKSRMACEKCKEEHLYSDECKASCKNVDEYTLEMGLYRDEEQSNFFKKKLRVTELHENKLDKENIYITNTELNNIQEILTKDIETSLVNYDFIFKQNYEQQSFIPTNKPLEFDLFLLHIDFNNEDEKLKILTEIKTYLNLKKITIYQSEIVNNTLKIYYKLNKYDSPIEILITIVETNPIIINYNDNDNEISDELKAKYNKQHTEIKDKITNDNVILLEQNSLNNNNIQPSIEKEAIFDIPNLPEFYNIFDDINNIKYYNFAQQQAENLNHNHNIYNTHYKIIT